MEIISLFSGAGGLDLGLKLAGNRIVWANDIDRDAVATYRLNVGNEITCADIRDVAIGDIPDGDVVVGGFPCQGFSRANLRRKVDDERNAMYRFFYEVIRVKQPRFFIAENVKGILSLGHGAVVRQIMADFGCAGYHVVHRKVNMADYGIPQHRERVIFVGQRVDLGEKMLFEFPVSTHCRDGIGKPKWVSIKEAIEGCPAPGDTTNDPNNYGSAYKFVTRNFTAHRVTDPEKPSPTILARGNGKGGVCAIPHYNGERRLTIRESATVQTFPPDFVFTGKMGSCYRQIGNAVPVEFGRILGEELIRIGKLFL
ncbi:MAG: DNA cytosine methyltransferase [Muribaculaceae bacterium]|nr:DNA cytosine methyltransferase [Muribaculaceae bacterium]